jgi:hypothetical protein
MKGYAGKYRHRACIAIHCIPIAHILYFWFPILMNIGYVESSQLLRQRPVVERILENRVTCSFSAEFHGLFKDKKDISHAEIGACAKLLKYDSDEPEKAIIEKELTELKMALDLMT